MRVTRMLSGAIASLLLVGIASADELGRVPGRPGPVPTRFEAKLAPSFEYGADGWALFQGYQRGAYAFSAELLVMSEDYKALGVDPSNGFADETVMLTIDKKEIMLRLVFLRQEPHGVVFAAAVKGYSSESLQQGDQVWVSINGTLAADGKF